ncbi:LysE family translocator [Streptomyces flavofungini]|uniref:LysE family transporter n=1 Tax=Streptomyces flavofungini TaxID=68200 RepID=A0ABS0XFC1_9ACTN|nr:LysE family transporter [Streptomyces flavofungini]MBJ3811933.1 LysE family transporter [Streptomyces flavofungini]GHC52346.1 lysine transporter LysE [Streptomyces flavofungini]
MAVSSITAFWAVSVLLILVPGADWAYAISAGLRDRSVAPAVGGLLLGYVGLTAVVAAGIAAVVADHPAVLAALTLLGALYLIFLGVTTLTRPSTPGAAPDDATGSAGATAGSAAHGPASRRSRVLQGAGISGLNPKALLLFLALLPQFTRPGTGWPLALQISTLGLVHILSCAAIYLSVGVLARTVLRTRPVAARAVTRISGAAMIVIGAVLVLEQLT